MIAAVFVDPNGIYAGLPDVDVWGIDRDARLATVRRWRTGDTVPQPATRRRIAAQLREAETR